MWWCAGMGGRGARRDVGTFAAAATVVSTNTPSVCLFCLGVRGDTSNVHNLVDGRGRGKAGRLVRAPYDGDRRIRRPDPHRNFCDSLLHW